jgi:hypothetical protein
MIRIWIVAILLIVACQGFAYGQGLFESIFGGGQQSAGEQFSSPQYYGGTQDPSQPFAQPPAGAGQQPMQYQQPMGESYPQQQYYPPGYGQPGVYSDWHTYVPGAQAPQPPVSYSAPPPVRQEVGPAPAPRRLAAPPAGSVGQPPARGAAPPAAQTGQPPLRPGQYSPGQRPGDADQLPAGAVQITTTTPDGTTVQYYPPAGEALPPQGGVRPQPRQARPKQAAAASTKKRGPTAPTAPEGAVSGSEGEATGIPMPKPVQIPAGRDPRSGWSRTTSPVAGD